MYSKHITLIISIIFFVQTSIWADSEIGHLEGVESYSSLAIVYGWFHNPKNDKWTVKENEIVGVDNFMDYYILTFRKNEKKIVAIVKE